MVIGVGYFWLVHRREEAGSNRASTLIRRGLGRIPGRERYHQGKGNKLLFPDAGD
jgi:hypothetical protein